MSNTYRVQHAVTGSYQYRCLSLAAQSLYITLCRLSNRLGDKNNENWFRRSINELIIDTNLSDRSITKGKRELITAYMIQEYREPDYTKHISNRYRIIQWQKVKFQRSNYRSIYGSNYRSIYDGSNKNTSIEKLPVSTKLIKPD